MKKSLKYLIIILLSIGFVIFILSLNKVQSKILNLVQQNISESLGYNISMDGFKFSLPFNIAVKKLEISDSHNVWLIADNLKVKIIPSFNILNNFRIYSLYSDKILLDYIPEEIKSDSSETTSPNIYINKIHVNNFEISSNITKLSYPLQNPITAKIVLHGNSNILDFSLKTDFDKYNIKTLQNFTLSTDGEYNVKEDFLDLKNITIIKPDALEARGSMIIDIAKNKITSSLNIDSKSVSNLIPTLQNNPNLKIAAKSLITLEGTLNNISSYHGRFKFETLNKDLPALKINSIYSIGDHGYNLKISDSNIDSCLLTGNLDISDDNYIVSGNIKNNCPNLTMLSKYIPQIKEGKINVDIKLYENNKHQAANSNIKLSDIKTDYINFSNGTIDLTFYDINNLKPDLFNATLNDNLVDNYPIDKINLKLSYKYDVFNLNTQIENNSASQNLNFNTQINYTDKNKFDVTIQNLNAKYFKHNITLKQPINIKLENDNLSFICNSLLIDSGNFSASGKIDHDKIEFNSSSQNIPLNLLYNGAPIALDRAEINGKINITGTTTNPVISSDLFLDKIYLSDKIALAHMPINAQYQNNILKLKSSMSHQNISDSSIDINLPLNLSFKPFNFQLQKDKPINGKLNLSLYIDRLDGMFLPLPNHVKGKLTGNLKLDGSLNSPTILGKLNLTEGGYRNSLIGTEITNISANLSAHDNKITLTNLIGYDLKNNKIITSGWFNFNNKDKFQFAANTSLTNFTALNNSNVNAVIDANLKLDGNQDGAKISGNILSKNIELRIPELLSQSIPTLNIVQTIPNNNSRNITTHNSHAKNNYPILIDITIKAPEKVFVRGRGLDTEIFGNLKISGFGNNPKINGKLTTKKGRYEEFGKRFVIKEGTLTFEGDIPPSPYIYMVASNTTKDFEIMPVISGSMLSPKINIKSNPSLPEDEALSRLLFSSAATNISPIQAIQLANSLRKLSGYSAPSDFDPLSKARKILGVDDVNVESDPNNPNNSVVGVGKYISDKVYLQFKGGSTPTSDQVVVEVELTPSISINSSTGTANNNSVGLSWKKNY